ncbi:MAG TPA: MBL fold metallo-hydrolase [bacterium]|nr:MBL fold metallo-hydrolase [bacterium]
MYEALKNVKWLGHASFKIEAEGKVIYIDPFKIKNPTPADAILVTHEHFDHLSQNDINALAKKGTVIVCPAKAAKELHECRPRKIKKGEILELGWVKIEAVAAYNINKDFHGIDTDKAGYLIDFGGFRYYHAGDTDFIPEMNTLKNVNVALLPVGGTYTMNAAEAAQAAAVIGADVSVPMHWGTIIGARKDAEEFKRILGDKAEILEISA